MGKSNYDVMRDQMEKEFLIYDQQKMIQKYDLKHDEEYIYITFIGRNYRVSRSTGRVEWTADGFLTAVHAGYNESMTMFDVLCYAKEDSCLSGRFAPVNQLKGTVKSASVGDNLFHKTAKLFEHRTELLSRACELLGGLKEKVGDVSYRISIFDFLPVILQFWDSDDEFEPVLKIMWDENILSYMHYETTYFAIAHLWECLIKLMEEQV